MKIIGDGKCDKCGELPEYNGPGIKEAIEDGLCELIEVGQYRLCRSCWNKWREIRDEAFEDVKASTLKLFLDSPKTDVTIQEEEKRLRSFVEKLQKQLDKFQEKLIRVEKLG